MLEKERTRFISVAIRHWGGLVSPSLSQAISLARFTIAIAASFTLPKFTANHRFALHWLVVCRLLQAGVHVCFLHFAPPFHEFSALQPLENWSQVLSIRSYSRPAPRGIDCRPHYHHSSTTFPFLVQLPKASMQNIRLY